MSFCTSPPVAPSPFDIVRRSCLHQYGLPFADALTAEQIAQAFAAEGVSFGDGDPRTVYTRAITLWAMLSQALFTGAERACRAAVLRVAAYYALLGRILSILSKDRHVRSSIRSSIPSSTEAMIHWHGQVRSLP